MAKYKHKCTQWFLDQVGYIEKSKAAYLANPNILYEKTAGAGSDNYTKYGKEMHDIYPSVMDFPAYWCDATVDDGFYNNYGVANAKGLLGGDFDDYTKGSINLYKSKNAFHLRKEPGFVPEEGDQIFFSKDDTFNGVHHTGYLYACDGKKVYTVEGNTSAGKKVVPNGGEVCKKEYYINDSRIYGYGRPNYAYYEKEETKPIEQAKAQYNKGDSIEAFEYINEGYVTKLKEAKLKTTMALLIRKEPDYSVRPRWFKTKDGYVSAYRVEGWVVDDYGKWYVKDEFKYPASTVVNFGGKDYAFDKNGYVISKSRLSDDDSVIY